MRPASTKLASTMGRAVNQFEESIIALLFAAMTIVTTSQVVARYVFNSGAVWALELTTYCFAWLVLFGVSYGIKVSAHLGVDVFAKLFPLPAQRALGLLVVAAGLVYGGLMLKGSWDYVGKLYKIGISSEDLPIPQWVPMVILIIGMVLLILRLLQAGWKIVKGETTTMLADETRHAIEELIEEPPGATDRPGEDRGDRT